MQSSGKYSIPIWNWEEKKSYVELNEKFSIEVKLEGSPVGG